jgi:hypothetical protein
VAACTCRHEFVQLLMNLFTEEGLTYYEKMLSWLMAKYNEETGKKLDWFVLDIGCRLAAWWEK